MLGPCHGVDSFLGRESLFNRNPPLLSHMIFFLYTAACFSCMKERFLTLSSMPDTIPNNVSDLSYTRSSLNRGRSMPPCFLCSRRIPRTQFSRRIAENHLKRVFFSCRIISFVVVSNRVLNKTSSERKQDKEGRNGNNTGTVNDIPFDQQRIMILGGYIAPAVSNPLSALFLNSSPSLWPWVRSWILIILQGISCLNGWAGLATKPSTEPLPPPLLLLNTINPWFSRTYYTSAFFRLQPSRTRE